MTESTQESPSVATMPDENRAQDYDPAILANRLRQRMAFASTGVELYDSILTRFEGAMAPPTSEVVSMEVLRRFREEQAQRVALLETILAELGVNPSVPPSPADDSLLAAMGLPRVIQEPQTTELQCLEAAQLAEFSDNTAWENLQELCLGMGLSNVIARFSKPLSQGKIHQEKLTDWIARILLARAKRSIRPQARQG